MIYAGLDLGGTKCAAVLAEVNGEAITFLDRREVPTQGTWRDVMAPLLDFLKGHALAGCGVSCGGPLDSRAGVILNPPNLMSFENVPIVQVVQEALGCPARLQNDADACALAEWRFGAGRGTQNMIFLTFGTGLGAGLILNGQLYVGARNLAGEVGHIRLASDGPEGYRKRGSFEGFCSGGGIAQLIGMRTGETYTAKELARRADSNDPQALAVWEEIGTQFGRGLAVLVDILNPEAVVAGSIYTRAHRFLYEPAMRALREEALPESLAGFRLLPAELGDSIGDYAAIAIGT
ncbi:MAG: ROK family protein [Firmicutes bacterium]|nr:ROK family protein [Bacillota bacterium]